MKHFLKLNLKKILYFNALLILFIITYLLGILINAGAAEPILRGTLLFILALPLFIVDTVIGTQGLHTITIILLLIIQVIYLYVLSSTIYYITKK